MARIVFPSFSPSSSSLYIDGSPNSVVLLGRSQVRHVITDPEKLRRVSRFAAELTVLNSSHKRSQDPMDRPLLAELINTGSSPIEVRSPNGSTYASLNHGQSVKVKHEDAIVLLPSSNAEDERDSTFLLQALRLSVPPAPTNSTPPAHRTHQQAPPSPSSLPPPRTLLAPSGSNQQNGSGAGEGAGPTAAPVPEAAGSGEEIVVEDQDEEEEVLIANPLDRTTEGAAAPPATVQQQRGAPPASTAPPRPRPQVLILIGVQGAGKSTFAKTLVERSGGSWARINQDTIASGKRGTRDQCLNAARRLLTQGVSVIVDRCNFNPEQRASFIQVAQELDVVVQCVHFQFPLEECKRRASGRMGHEGGLEGEQAVVAINRMASLFAWPGPRDHEGMVRGFVAKDDRETAAILSWILANGGGFSPDGTLIPTPPTILAWTARIPVPRPVLAPTRPAPPPRAKPFSSDAFSVLLQGSRAMAAGGNLGGRGPSSPSAHRGGRGAGAGTGVLQSLVRIAQRPESAEGRIRLESDLVMVHDKYPKARHHALVLPRDTSLAFPWDLKRAHLPLLRRMVEAGKAWAGEQQQATMKLRGLGPGDLERAESQDSSTPRRNQELVFRLGFHLQPSMAQVHLHVISQDFCSESIKKKEHYNSFATDFFVPVEEVIEEIERTGGWSSSGPEKDARVAKYHAPLGPCVHCGFRGKNLPDLKQHLLQHA